MGRIKSALEIALERTESVKSDKGSIDQFEAKQQGKKLANQFLGEDAQRVSIAGTNLAEAIKKTPRDQQESLKQGIFDVLLSQITLPLSRDDEKRIEAVGKGLQLVINDNKFTALYKQLSQLLTRYLDESAQYDEAIRRQYEPKLRQKEEELSRRMGRKVQIDPLQDPEFLAFYNQNMNALKGNYQTAVDQVREEARRIFEGKRMMA
ncbi:hypothetical protein AGMMS50268_25980 [Spirochaetia bacterium]|nr:hypothetical protein AGMMS50268_25980 [Spirochaetia bacterium]